jgi:hypothetical protein
VIESSAAGLGGIGFVLTAVVVNLVYVRARLPLPMSGQGMDELVDALAAVGSLRVWRRRCGNLRRRPPCGCCWDSVVF